MSGNWQRMRNLSGALKKEGSEVMAGRPVREEFREARRREVDATIRVIQKRRQPVTRKTIAEEMGISVQSLYGAGFLSSYISELEGGGVVVKERGNAAGLTAAEAKKLRKTIDNLQDKIKCLKEKLDTQEKSLAEKDAEIEELIEQLEIERGNTFLKQKRDFAQCRI